MPSLLEYNSFMDDQTARARVRAAMRLVSAEVLAEVPPAGASSGDLTEIAKRRRVVERWSEAPGHWLPILSEQMAGAAGIIAVGLSVTKPDEEMSEEARDSVDNAVLDAIRAAVGTWKDR